MAQAAYSTAVAVESVNRVTGWRKTYSSNTSQMILCFYVSVCILFCKFDGTVINFTTLHHVCNDYVLELLHCKNTIYKKVMKSATY